LQIHPVIGEARPASLTNKKQEFLPNPCDNLAKRSGASINCKKKKKKFLMEEQKVTNLRVTLIIV